MPFIINFLAWDILVNTSAPQDLASSVTEFVGPLILPASKAATNAIFFNVCYLYS